MNRSYKNSLLISVSYIVMAYSDVLEIIKNISDSS